MLAFLAITSVSGCLCLTNPPRVLIGGAIKSFWVFLSAGFSATLILCLLGLVNGITFAHWWVGRHSGRHQMSPSQWPPSKACPAGWVPFFWETQPHCLRSGFSSNGHHISTDSAGLVYCPNFSREDPKCKQNGLMSSKYGGYVIKISLDRTLLKAEQSISGAKKTWAQGYLQTPKLSFNELPVGFPTVPSKAVLC